MYDIDSSDGYYLRVYSFFVIAYAVSGVLKVYEAIEMVSLLH